MFKPTTVPASEVGVPGLCDPDGLQLLLPPDAEVADLEWGFRLVHPDFTSSRGFRWPFPGRWAEADGPIRTNNADPCPADAGDGICAARSWAGASSGGITSPTALVVAWTQGDVLGVSPSKVRLRRAWVAEAITTRRLIGPGADLRCANLHHADLRYANLTNANLHGADLHGARDESGLIERTP